MPAQLQLDISYKGPSEALDSIQQAIAPIQGDPDFQELVEKVQSVFIEIAPCDSAQSFFGRGQKRIHLDPSMLESGPHRILECLLFELENLAQESEFEHILNSQDLSADQLVSKFEEVEYQSAVKTQAIVRRNFQPSQWKQFQFAVQPKGFPEHYLLQQINGHSRKIYQEYEKRCRGPYLGTWSTPIKEDEKEFVEALLSLIFQTEDSEPSVSEKAKTKLNHFVSNVRKAKIYDKFYARIWDRIREVESIRLGSTTSSGESPPEFNLP